MVIRVFVASSSGSVAVSGGERRGERRGAGRPRPGLSLRGRAQRRARLPPGCQPPLVVPAVPSPPAAPGPSPARRRGAESRRAAAKPGVNLPRLRVRCGGNKTTHPPTPPRERLPKLNLFLNPI